MYYVYVLKSTRTKWIYVGYTSDLKKRFDQHNSKMSVYTSYRGPWQLAYYEAYVSKLDAMNRERSLKRHAKALGLLKKRIARSLKGEGA